jgi:hypothetical protein
MQGRMHVRGALLAAVACALTSLALVAASAQAAVSNTGAPAGGSRSAIPSKLPKIKGAKVYEYCENGHCYGSDEFTFAVYSKTKKWEFLYDGAGYGVGGYIEKYKKNPYTYFYYTAEGFEAGCYLDAIKASTGYVDGDGSCPEHSLNPWEAKKQ